MSKQLYHQDDGKKGLLMENRWKGLCYDICVHSGRMTYVSIQGDCFYKILEVKTDFVIWVKDKKKNTLKGGEHYVG